MRRPSQRIRSSARKPPGPSLRFGSRLYVGVVETRVALPPARRAWRRDMSRGRPDCRIVDESRRAHRQQGVRPASARASSSAVNTVTSAAASSRHSRGVRTAWPGLRPRSHRQREERLERARLALQRRRAATSTSRSTSECGNSTPRPKPPTANNAQSGGIADAGAPDMHDDALDRLRAHAHQRRRVGAFAKRGGEARDRHRRAPGAARGAPRPKRRCAATPRAVAAVRGVRGWYRDHGGRDTGLKDQDSTASCERERPKARCFWTDYCRGQGIAPSGAPTEDAPTPTGMED